MVMAIICQQVFMRTYQFLMKVVRIIKFNKLFLYIFSLKLTHFLYENFDEEKKRFDTSRVKVIIDLCDILLGRLYSSQFKGNRIYNGLRLSYS